MSLKETAETRKRNKTWEQKVQIVEESYQRSKNHPLFARRFYENLFYLNSKIKDYFANTDLEHQVKALMHGMDFLVKFLDHKDENARSQVIRLAKSHSVHGLKIHPHHYYYWIDALIMTAKEFDPQWYDSLEYYWREVIFFPISFMISQYFSDVA